MHKKDLYAEHLLRFKENEKPEAVLMIADSPHLVKIVVAWTSMPVCRMRHLIQLKGATDEAVWRWLWANTEYSGEELVKRIPAADATTNRKIEALIANRVLYPDGTANGFVEKFLREQVLRHFCRKQTRKSQ
jgi:hypothetical protein